MTSVLCPKRVTNLKVCLNDCLFLPRKSFLFSSCFLTFASRNYLIAVYLLYIHYYSTVIVKFEPFGIVLVINAFTWFNVSIQDIIADPCISIR